MANTPTGRVGEHIREQMARQRTAGRHVTQTKMAEALGINQSQLSKRLSGVIPIDVDELVKIAAYLEVPVETLTADLAEAASA